MSNAAWGTKRTCPKCAARFYDLGKHPVVCPKCNCNFDPAALLKPRRGRARKFSNLTETAANVTKTPSKPEVVAKSPLPKKKLVGDDDDSNQDDALVDADDLEDMESLDSIETDTDKDEEEADDATLIGGYGGDALIDDFEEEEEEDEDDDLVDADDEDGEDEDEDEDEDDDDSPARKKSGTKKSAKKAVTKNKKR